MAARHQQFLQAGSLVAIPVNGERAHAMTLDVQRFGGEAHAQHLHPEVPAAQPVGPHLPPQPPSSLQVGHTWVVVVPASDRPGDSERDFYVACACGWASRPMIERPTPDRLVCEACEERLRGHEVFLQLARVARARGFHIERC